MVYIEEAHPGNTVGGLHVNQTENYGQREAVAELCTTSLDLTFPTVLDKLDNAVEKTYAAFPDRIYVLDSDGVVRHKTLPGPQGWDTAGPRATLDRLWGTLRLRTEDRQPLLGTMVVIR